MYKSRSEVNAFQVRILAAAVASCFASAALANPTGGMAVQGTVSMDTPALGQLHITNSPNSIIHWDSFSIRAGELTKFIQDSASSAVLNRVVVPGNLSEILGTLQSNGRVFLINPNGITIGAGAVLDLPGFVASSLDMTDADFTAGRMRFQQAPGVAAGTVTNQASVFMPDGGQVYLIGGSVVNEPGGFINSPNGEVVLAAGHSVELMSAGAPGVSVAIAAPENEALNLGQIFAGAGSAGIFGGVINQGGVVSANDAFFGPGGTIQLRATGATTLAAGSTTSAGDLQIDTGSLHVAGAAFSGTQSVHADGGVVVENAPGGFAQIGATNGQTIDAGYVEVVGNAGGSASIFNFGGEQRIRTSSANTAGEGLAVRAFDGGFATIDSPFAPQTIAVRNADRLVVEGASGFASVNSFGGTQSISLTGGGDNALVLGSPDARFQSLIGANDQTILAGNPDERGSITVHGTADGSFGTALLLTFSGAGGSQTVSTSGELSVFGGSAPGNSATGIFANQAGGHQTIRAGSILLQGGGEGGGNSAMIGANDGSQAINVGAGGITLRGGAGGGNNFAMINQASTDPAATQTISSAGPVLLEGGSGNFNFAMIRAFGGHQTFEAGDTTLLAGAGGIDNFSTLQGRVQDVTVHGDLEVTARGSAGSPAIGGGARVGGLGGGAPTPTQLTLNVEGNLTMTGGSLAGTGVLLGNTTNFTGDTDISVNAGGNVTLSGGSVPGTFAVIGSRAGNLAGGDIRLAAGGGIALNSTAPDQASIIRTADGVALTAQHITQDPDAQIEAGGLSVQTEQGASLTGANVVSALSLSNMFSGDVAFNNASDQLIVTQALNIPGALSLQQTGDMLVTGHISSGPQTIGVSGGLRVENAPFSFAQIGATNGQTIDAGYVEVVGNAGGSASIFNFGGDQHIATSGANADGESLALRGGDNGFAGIASSGGTQSVVLSGPGPNALVMETTGETGGTSISGDTQTIVAGNPGESGSITLRGPVSQISSSPLPGGSQTVTTSGTLTLAGSATDFSFGPAGIFALSPDGQQTVRADSIRLQGGDGGNGAVIVAIDGAQLIEAGAGGISLTGGAAPGNGGAAIVQQSSNLSLTQTVRSGDAIVLQGGSMGGGNSAVIAANGGAQTIEAGAGGITLRGGDTGGGNSAVIAANGGAQTIKAGADGIALRGGDTGGNNFAMINQASTDPAATQTISSTGPVLLEGGSGGFNFAMIRAFGGHQAFEAGDTTLLAGAGGIDNFSTLQGRVQDVTVHGDLAIVARGSGGSPNVGGGARIGGLGGAAPSATNLALDIGGNLTMTAGSVSGTGVSIGGNIVDDLPSNVAATVGGNVTLNGGTAPDTFARVGSANSGATGGSIDITAGGAIALNSSAPDQASIIRTTDDVALNAQQITQGPDARIEAGSLTTHTTAGASLAGANSVNELAMLNAASGEVAFNNTSALLTVTGIDQVPHGALTLSQVGDLLISGDVTSGAQTISATGDMTIAPGIRPNVTVRAHGAQTFNVGGTFSLFGGNAWNGYAQTLASGPVSITTGNDLLVRGGGGLLAYALLYGGDDMHLTVGNELRIDGGSRPFAFARVQTDFWDRIYLTFPNRASGGYFVNGREGVTRSGLDGFFTGLRPAIRNRSLIVSYGE